MTFYLAQAYAQFLSRLLLNATCILNIFWIVSVNLMGIMWLEDYMKVFVYLRIEMQIFSLHWMMQNIRLFDVCEARRASRRH